MGRELQMAVNVIDEILAARRYGVIHCGTFSRQVLSLAELAREFGLSGDAAHYREIDAASARRLAELVLHVDLAYKMAIMPAARAGELADRFLSQFANGAVRYFTNGTFHELPGARADWSGTSWDPVTDATFDTGVLVLGPEYSGCLWVEDED
jgi:hypothetical protein